MRLPDARGAPEAGYAPRASETSAPSIPEADVAFSLFGPSGAGASFAKARSDHDRKLLRMHSRRPDISIRRATALT